MNLNFKKTVAKHHSLSFVISQWSWCPFLLDTNYCETYQWYRYFTHTTTNDGNKYTNTTNF